MLCVPTVETVCGSLWARKTCSGVGASPRPTRLVGRAYVPDGECIWSRICSLSGVGGVAPTYRKLVGMRSSD